jgi:four helix bundle protein
MRDYRDLEVWQKSMDLAVSAYAATAKFPRTEQFNLTAQIRRAAVSVASNIAEGAGRRTTKDFIAFTHTARGSLAELETQMLLAARIGLPICIDAWESKLNELGRLLNGLIRSLEQKVSAGTHLK